MLKKILSINGRPGLYKLLSYGNKSVVVVESLVDKKRQPISPRERIISLGDIAMYTDAEEVPLREVLTAIYKKESGKALNLADYKEGASARAYMDEILPTYDRDRVYDSDIQKLLKWYNILVAAGFTSFEEEKGEETPAEETAETPAEKPAKKAEKKAEKKTGKKADK